MLTDDFQKEDGDIPMLPREFTHALRNHVEAMHADELDDVAGEDGRNC